MDRFEEIELEKIVWEDPIRPEISEKDITDMAKSIFAGGLIHPIIVERKDGQYRGVVRRLRYLGAQQAGKLTIECRIHSFVDHSDRKAWQLIENLVRRDLNAIHKAEGYRDFKKYTEKGLDAKPEEVAKPIVKLMRKQFQEVSGEKAPAEKTIYQYLQVAEIPEDVKKILRSLTGQNLGIAHGLQLLRLKDDHKGMLKIAELIRNNKPSKRQLKSYIDDYLKTEKQATERVKKAVEDREISLKHAATISEADTDLQQPILEMTKRGCLKPTQTKKVVDFVETHPDVDILSKPPEQAVAIAQGKEVLTTPEQVDVYFRGRKGLAEQEEFYCVNCKTRFIVDWKKGEVKF